MSFTDHAAALRAVTRFGAQYDTDNLYSYRFETNRNGSVSVRVYSPNGTFLAYI